MLVLGNGKVEGRLGIGGELGRGELIFPMKRVGLGCLVLLGSDLRFADFRY